MIKPRRGQFRIRTADGADVEDGWILGDFAAKRERFFWRFTHLRTGLGVSGGVGIDGKAAAMEHLAKLSRGEGLATWEVALLAGQPDLAAETVAS